MGDHYQGDPLLPVKCLQQCHHLLAGVAVQIAGGLIGQQQGRRHGHGAAYGHPLALAAGEFGRFVAGAVAQRQPLQQGIHPLPAQGRRHAAEHQGQLDVFPGA